MFPVIIRCPRVQRGPSSRGSVFLRDPFARVTIFARRADEPTKRIGLVRCAHAASRSVPNTAGRPHLFRRLAAGLSRSCRSFSRFPLFDVSDRVDCTRAPLFFRARPLPSRTGEVCPGTGARAFTYNSAPHRHKKNKTKLLMLPSSDDTRKFVSVHSMRACHTIWFVSV